MTPASRRALARVAVRFTALASLAIVGASTTACNLDKLLKVRDVDVATPESVNSSAGLPVVYSGGLADFEAAVNGTDATVTLPGLMADELRDIDTFPTRIEIDQRHVLTTGPDLLVGNNGTVQGWYRQMHQARASLKRATAAFSQFAPGDPRNAEMHALEGLMYIYFGEDFCNGVAYSDFVNGQPKYGAPTTKAQSFQLAVAQADSAAGIAKAGSNEMYLAQLVKGRALMDLGDYANAATAVQGVPVDWNYWVYNSENSGRENNGVYINVGPVSKRFGVANLDSPHNIAFRDLGWNDTASTGDARVRWYKSGIGQDGQSVAYYTSKYPSRSAPISVASGVEAQLIAAEADLKAGGTAWLDILNSLRANTAVLDAPPYTLAGQKVAPALPALTDPGTPDARVDLLFQERALWLYLTGHRLGDMRRLIVQYGRSADSVFPSGTYLGAAGGEIGPDVNFPVPIDEQNNPSAPHCADRNP